MSPRAVWLVDNDRKIPWIGAYLSIAKYLNRQGVETAALGYYTIGMPLSGLMTRPSLYEKTGQIVVPLRNPKAKLEFVGRILGILDAPKLAGKLAANKTDFVITISYFEGLPAAAREAGCKSILWSVDDPYTHCEKYFEYAAKFDVVLTYSLGSIPIYKKHGIKATWFPSCMDPEFYFAKEPRDEKLDFSFTGNCLADREPGHRRMLYPLIGKYGKALHVFGRSWDASLGCTVHGPIDWRRIPEVNRQSKIVLNLHREPHRLLFGTIAPRLFESIGCGSFVMSDYPLGLEELFEPGRDLVVVGENESPLEKASYYLEHGEERRKIAERGYRKVVGRDTASHRADFLIRNVLR